jgi:hypothetical protein
MANDKETTLKQLEQILAKRRKYVVKSDRPARRNLGINPDINEMYDVLATTIKDLKEQGIFK